MLLVFSAAAILATRQSLLFAREARVTDALSTAVAEFRSEVLDTPGDRSGELLRALDAAEGDLPADTRLSVFVDGQELATADDGVRAALPANGPWETATRSQEGEFEQRGATFAYLTVPILGGAETNAVLVASTPLRLTPAGVQQAVSTVAAVLALLLLPALSLTWWLTGPATARRQAPVGLPSGDSGAAPPPPPPDPGTRVGGTVDDDAPATPRPGFPSDPSAPVTTPPPSDTPATASFAVTPSGTTGAQTVGTGAAPGATRTATGGPATQAPAVRRPGPGGGGPGTVAIVDDRVSLSQITLDIYAAAQDIDDREWILDVPSTAVVHVDPALTVQAGLLMARFTADQVGPEAAIVVGGERRDDEVHIYVQPLSGPAGADSGSPTGSTSTRHDDDLLTTVAQIAAAHGGRLDIGVGDDAPTTLTLILPQR